MLKLITAPLAPVNSVRTETFSGSEMRITWLDNAKAETGYKIYAAKRELTENSMVAAGPVSSLEQAADFVEVASVPANSTAALLTGLESGRLWLRLDGFGPFGRSSPPRRASKRRDGSDDLSGNNRDGVAHLRIRRKREGRFDSMIPIRFNDLTTGPGQSQGG